ncbi:MAG TPA: thioredoxin domain-containing protein [Candidatus Sabulitectum sp.]|nr:thioredoxin domain-containing protein [Candidatus Sabulitectum sp.]HPJ29161.1 thioredoxin domain-containing protein [Candidatus Sabulitectum sp.]HPR23011.1 thioredoxin domain-containing protein [Candidatus Sabulitectum sp.]HRW78131.1 thioredoxin domain-containing protein [Candidatus Sabulitectum sp.]
MKTLLFLTPVLFLMACGQSGEAQASAPEAQGTTEAEWIHDDLDAALAQAAETGKPVFVDMYADWCGPCRMLADDYFSRNDYKEVLSSCVLVKINTDNNQALAARYGIQSIPTLILMDSQGNEIDRITGVMGSPESFLPMIEEFIAQGL